MPLQVGIEEESRETAVYVGGLQYCQYSQKKISLITLLSDLVVCLRYMSINTLYKGDDDDDDNNHQILNRNTQV